MGGGGVESGGCFVAEQEFRICGQSSCNGDSLFLSAGKLSRIGRGLATEVNQIQEFSCFSAGLITGGAVKFQRKGYIVEDIALGQ
jgi:hypothetical protein